MTTPFRVYAATLLPSQGAPAQRFVPAPAKVREVTHFLSGTDLAPPSLEALMKDRMDGDTKKVERAAGANPDPITGEPGAHHVGTGVGPVGGAAAGVAVG